MRRVLFAAGVCVAPFIASQVGAQDSALAARDSSMLNTSSVSDAPWGSRDMVRPVRPSLRERAIPSTLQTVAEDGRGSSAVRRGAWIGAGIGFTAGVYSGLRLASTSGCKVSSDCDKSRAWEYAYLGTTLLGSTMAGGLLGACIGKVVQLAVSHPSAP